MLHQQTIERTTFIFEKIIWHSTLTPFSWVENSVRSIKAIALAK